MSTSNQPTIQAPPARFRLRVRYAKRGRLRYLGHLELIHTIERCIRRAALPYAVSQGFSPHMRVGYTAALPVGTGSSCEYYDVFLTELVPVAEAFARLKAVTPIDIEPQAAAYVDLRAPALTADINRLDYAVELAFREGRAATPDEVGEAVRAVRAKGELPYVRGKKRKTLDLGNLIACGARDLPEGRVLLDLETRCDNEGSIRPELVLAAMDQALRGIDPGSEEISSTGIQELACIERYRVERTSQLIGREDGSFVPPLPDSITPPAGFVSTGTPAKL